MKLLEFPPGLCPYVEINFSCDTWNEFDQTCAWLIKNGVALEVFDYNEARKFLVHIKNKSAYIGGKLVNRDLTGGGTRVVSGEDMGINYTVMTPDGIR